MDKKKILALFSVISTSALAMTVVFATKPDLNRTFALMNRNVATSNDYVNEFYCRTKVGNSEKYLTYVNASKKMSEGDITDALYTVNFTSTSTAKLKIGDTFLGWSSGTDFNTNEYEWNVHDGALYNQDNSRLIMFQSGTVNAAKVYAVSNIGKENYYAVYFYTQAEFEAGEQRCNWPSDSDRYTQLSNLAYDIPEITTYTVSFDAGEGSGTKDSIQVVENEQITIPTYLEFTAPTGKEFDTWYNGDTKVSFPLTVTEDITLTAHWKESTDSWQDATMTAGSNSSSCTVNGDNGIKCGSSSKAGVMTITLSNAGATTLKIYVAGWNGEDGKTVNVTISSGTITPASFTTVADSGISGNSSSFTLSGDAHTQEFTLSEYTAGATVTLTAKNASKNRFVIWAAQYK